ncbi:MAG: hypothetical protein HZB39_04455 [Planctomycetes bacterium]|nr:hypothetical protein [Planctomycetota bacterium]
MHLRLTSRAATSWLAGLVLAASLSAQCPPGPNRTCYTLRSGPGQGITGTFGLPAAALSGGAFTGLDFSAAAIGTELVEVTSPPGSWLNSNSFWNPQAKWIGKTSGGAPGSFLLSHPFVLDGCAFANACIEFHFAADDQLGDTSGGANQIGVFLNGNPIAGSAGGGFTTESTWTATGIGGLLLPGCNRLEVYVRDVLGGRSGVLYSARICFDDECLAKEHINLHTGNGLGPNDAKIRALSVTPGVAITPAQFVAARGIPTPFAQFITPWTGWCTNVGNSAAGWIGNSGYGTLYCQPFEISACNITSLRIDARGALYRFLGDDAGNPNVGVWINDHPILGSVADGLGGTACLSGSATIGGCHVQTGTNYLYVYVRDVIGPIAPFTALLYDVNLTVTSCAMPEQVTFASGPGVMQRSGPASSPLQLGAFVWPTDFTCSNAAVVVPAYSSWCPSISGSPAVWLSNNASRGPASIMFCQDFTVNTCTGSIGKAILNLRYAVDDHLGDGVSGGPNIAGLYVNGQPVYVSGTTTGAAGICRTMTRNITSLVHQGVNTFTLYCRDTQAVISGAMWDAVIDIDPCPRRGVVVGSGCFDRHALLEVRDDFVLGATGSFEITPGSPAALGAVLGLGFFSTPPIDLSMFGAPGCSLDIGLAATIFAPIFGPPVSFPLSIPNDPSVVGASLYAQGFVLDPTVNALGIDVTQALRVTIED